MNRDTCSASPCGVYANEERLVRADGLIELSVRRFSGGRFHTVPDIITPEIKIHLYWPERQPIALAAFPHALEDLALGHALLECCQPGLVPRLIRRVGHDFHLVPEPAGDQVLPARSERLNARQLLGAMNSFIKSFGRGDATGCFHRVSLFDLRDCAIVHQIEDIGRHNCVDRSAGFCLRQGLIPSRYGLFISARTTASFVSKVIHAGFSVLVSRAATTTAGIELAAEAGLTLIGFARSDRITVYCDPSDLLME